MTLATHAIVGASAATLFPGHPEVGFLAAFASHFVIDAIPHWDYQLLSRKTPTGNYLDNDLQMNKLFLYDLVKIGFDFWLGIILSVLLLQSTHAPLQWNILVGALGGMLPDALQFAYFRLRREPLTSLQRLHHLVHAKKRLTGRPFLGVAFQVILVGVVILLVRQF